MVVDAVGNSITLEPILKADLKDYAASDGGNTQAEADHPSLSMQVQGICPYGWHIANMSDWKDLIYAVAESSKSYSDYPVAAATASYGAMTSGNAANAARSGRTPSSTPRPLFRTVPRPSLSTSTRRGGASTRAATTTAPTRATCASTV